MQVSTAAEALQHRFNDFQRQRAEFLAERNQLAADRTAFENRAREFAQQVARDRSSQREVTAELDQRQQQLRHLQAELEQRQTLIADQQKDLDARRERLHEAVNQELARERQQLQTQRETLQAERQQLLEKVAQQDRDYEDRRLQLEESLQAEKELLKQKVRQELAEELEQLHRERQEWDQYRESSGLELQRQTEDLQQQRELFGQQLEAEQQRLRDEIEKRRQALLTEQNNLQRRYRFQFEHLNRAREDFETEKRELRREQQIFRSERRAFDEQHRLRFGQLQQIRQALAERERSLKREQKVIERGRIAGELDLQRQQERLREQEDAILQDLDSRTRRLNQAEQAASETAYRVEQRLQHVTQLRSELDAQQRDILEQRLLLEELQASETFQGKTAPGGSERWKQARRAVEQFFEQLHQQLRSERERLESRAAELNARQEQFRQDRLDLEQWFADQEISLSQKTAQQPNGPQPEDIRRLESQLASVRQEWFQERREAEATIRRLLDQITDLESAAFQMPVSFATDESFREDDADTDHRSAA
ncbi:MAG: hypothetical protein KDA81_07990 [Planctomycetaceae bacterium]|nr:hypothetical protein [Planctomycetaceae bacterium]